MIQTSKVKFQIGFMRRYDPAFQEAKRKIEEGFLGEVILIKSTGRGPGLPPEWAWDIRKSNGILAEVSSHDFDSIRWFSGSEFKKVYAEAGNFKTPEVRQKYPDFYDNAVVTVRCKNGAMGLVDGSCPAGYGYDARVEILGSKGMMQIGELKNKGVTLAPKKKDSFHRFTGVGQNVLKRPTSPRSAPLFKRSLRTALLPLMLMMVYEQ